VAERTLVVLRHAKAAWPEGVPDRQRPLAARGERDARVAGRWISDRLAPLDLVVRSPALRVEQTWNLVAAEWSATPTVREDERLYAEPIHTVLQVVRELPDETHTVLLIGHNPELSMLVSLLTGREIALSTASIAVLSATGSWTAADAGWAHLRGNETPRAH
jgi:phosphohistidine phosphatase